MDTEFPGIVYHLTSFSEDFYYQTLKLNVDSLKLIQLGITLKNSKNEYPKGHHTWQFNFEFDIEKDKYSKESLQLLSKSGINFEKLKNEGINHKLFAEYFMTSGLVLNPEVHWISFHGSYDFGYLLKYLLYTKLPKSDLEFTNQLNIYFPNHYDIRILVQGKEKLQGSLNKLAVYLDVIREGINHQAGSDSNVTVEVYFKLLKYNLINNEINKEKNILFGIGKGANNEETILYTKINYYKNNNNGNNGNNGNNNDVVANTNQMNNSNSCNNIQNNNNNNGTNNMLKNSNNVLIINNNNNNNLNYQNLLLQKNLLFMNFMNNNMYYNNFNNNLKILGKNMNGNIIRVSNGVI
jgi:CCR4-NOT transcription complex subunit 7/8